MAMWSKGTVNLRRLLVVVVVVVRVGVTTGVALSSSTALCYAQCKARCIDIRDGLQASPTSNTTAASPACWTQCQRPFLAADWTSRCVSINFNPSPYCSVVSARRCRSKVKNDGCVEKCLFLSPKNYTRGAEHYPDTPRLRLARTGPHALRLSWRRLAGRHAVVYVIADRPETASDWLIRNWTEDEWSDIEIDACGTYSYRVASVNQFGTKGFTAQIVTSDLARPGIISKVHEEDSISFVDDNFIYSFTFELPTGWDEDDLSDFEGLYVGKTCRSVTMPPVPIYRISVVEDDDNTSRVYRAAVKVYKFGYGCQYFSMVTAVSKCAVQGEPYNFTVDLTDCSGIVGYDCPVTTSPVTRVVGVTVDILSGRQVSITWRTSVSPAFLQHYIVQWGRTTNRILPILKQEGRRIVDKDVTELTIEVDHYEVEYGIKILAVPLSAEEMETRHSLNKMLPVKRFTIPAASQFLPAKSSPEVSDRQRRFILLYIFVPVVGVAIVVMATLLSRRYVTRRGAERQKKERHQRSSFVYNAFVIQKQAKGCMVKNPFYSLTGCSPIIAPPSDAWEISFDKLTLGAIIGRGAFGKVVKAFLDTPVSTPAKRSSLSCEKDLPPRIIVAVKMLLETADGDQRREFLQEITLMKRIGSHRNVVSIIGCCSAGDPVCLVVEHMPGGDLLNYLRRRRPASSAQQGSCPSDRLSPLDLLNFGRQIAVGMEFLSQKGFIHRDLATRNVLVGSEKTVKVGDFGLTRYVSDDHVYVTRHANKLPLKWMSIEAIRDLAFTTASDIWSFGVVLYELTTLGSAPYPSIPNNQLLAKLQAGYRMEKPNGCDQALYRLMTECWRPLATSRPSFSALRERLADLIAEGGGEHYLALSPALSSSSSSSPRRPSPARATADVTTPEADERRLRKSLSAAEMRTVPDRRADQLAPSRTSTSSVDRLLPPSPTPGTQCYEQNVHFTPQLTAGETQM